MTSPRVIAPNLKRRLSGVTSTVLRLVPVQAKSIDIVATGPVIPPEVPQIPLRRTLTMPRKPLRVWHARRNLEMLAGLALKHLLRKNLKLLFTSASQRRHSGYTKWLIGQMDAVVATSAKTAAYLEVPSQVILHGIDTKTFAPAPDRAALRTKLGLPAAGLLIGCYGRIRAQKGTDAFVDAMIDALPHHPNAHAVILGRAVDKDQSFLKDLQQKVRNAGLAERILFLPEVPTTEMADWYAALDLYVAPQRWEGFGLTPIEAMATGCPVIATRVGAFEEQIVEGETGTLVDPGDIPALASAVNAALADTDQLTAWRFAARARVEQAFTIEAEAEALIKIYEGLLSN